jgi:hypothetical protein
VGALILLSVGIFWPNAKITAETARGRAVAQVQRFGRDFAVDISRFDGPRPTVPPVNTPYGFEWTFADNDGTVTIYVWVDKDGWTEVTWEGNIDRLQTIPK